MSEQSKEVTNKPLSAMKTDILKLYIGSQCRTDEGETFKLTGLCRSRYYDEPSLYQFVELDYQKDPHSLYKNYPADKIKLILRPLSSMTEEEILECMVLISQKKRELKIESDHKIKFTVKGHGTMFIHTLDTYINSWLLSKGFDLFGLIESGSALDGTKL